LNVGLDHPLVIGYGNPDRQDDGVAWHVMCAMAHRLNLPAPSSYEEPFPPNPSIDFDFLLQLTPELSEQINRYSRVCFIDAHAGEIPESVRLIPLERRFQHSAFTHHLTPQSLLAMCASLYDRVPEAVLLTVRGFRFEFERTLSPQTAELVPKALDLILPWLLEK
jgi:hydrogenase maturation protease